MLKKHLFLSVIVIGILGLNSINAQNNEVQEQLEEVLELRQLGLLNGLILTEADGNTININEMIQNGEYRMIFPESIPATGNQSMVIQDGSNNEAYWHQNGNRNSFGLLQYGDGNNYYGTLTGEENLIRVLQLGNDNTVIQELEGDGMRLGIIQEGNNHEVTQIEKDGSSPAYQIHQQGTQGMCIIIEHQKVYP